MPASCIHTTMETGYNYDEAVLKRLSKAHALVDSDHFDYDNLSLEQSLEKSDAYFQALVFVKLKEYLASPCDNETVKL